MLMWYASPRASSCRVRSWPPGSTVGQRIREEFRGYGANLLAVPLTGHTIPLDLAAAAERNGWAGIVVDGAVRDLAELRAAKIGIRALALMPLRSVKRGEGQAGLPVEIRGVPIRPGDFLYADEDGIVVSDKKLV